MMYKAGVRDSIFRPRFFRHYYSLIKVIANKNVESTFSHLIVFKIDSMFIADDTYVVYSMG